MRALGGAVGDAPATAAHGDLVHVSGVEVAGAPAVVVRTAVERPAVGPLALTAGVDPDALDRLAVRAGHGSLRGGLGGGRPDHRSTQRQRTRTGDRDQILQLHRVPIGRLADRVAA